MDNHDVNSGRNTNEYAPSQEYSGVQQLVNNLPYVAMAILGAAVFVVGLRNSPGGWLAAGIYVVYAATGVLWVIIFICPYCHYWDTMACPCGYGRMAPKLREKKDGDRFREKFRKHIPVIVPLWFAPVLAGFYIMVRDFSWILLILLIAFAVDAFIILPLFSRKHGCAECPQKEACPWMGPGAQTG